MRPVTPLLFVAALLPAAPAAANQCAEIRAHIARLDEYIQKDTIASSRELRIRDRDNWVRAHNEICTGNSASDGMSSANRNAAALGLAVNALGLIRDIVREHEARQLSEQQAAELQQRMWEEQQALQREAEEQERRRQAAAARAADDTKRQTMANPFASGVSGPSSRSNPFAGGESNPFQSQNSVSDSSGSGATNPFTNSAPDARPPARLARTETSTVPSRGFRSDSEIKALCARAPNPKACETGEYAYREHMGPYQRWRAEAAAARSRGPLEAEGDIDRAIAEYRRQRARESPQQRGPGATNFPVEAFRQAPDIDRRGDGYDECRRGAVRPDTVVGCYEQPAGAGGRTAARGVGEKPQTKKKDALRQQVLERKAAREAEAVATVAGARAPTAATSEVARQEQETAPAEAVVSQSERDRAPPPPGFMRQILSREECDKLGGRSIPVHGGMPVCEHRIANPFQMRASETQREVDEIFRRFLEPASGESR